MRIKLNGELWSISAMAALLVIITAVIPSSILLRIIIGLPFLLFFPGYTSTAALLPRKDQVGGMERLFFSFGISVAVMMLTGLLLNSTSIGIQIFPVLFIIAMFTIVTAAMAQYRRSKIPEGEKFAIFVNCSFVDWTRQCLLDKALSILLIAAALGAIGTASYVGITSEARTSFTEFYLLGPDNKAQDYVEEVKAGEEAKVIIGIKNSEQQRTTYKIEVWIDGIVNQPLAPLALEQGETWEEPINFIPPTVGDNQKVEFFIYKNGETEAFLPPLRLWINVNPQ